MACQARAFWAIDHEALAGLVDGRRRYCTEGSAAIRGLTCRRKRASAVAPLKQIRRICGCSARNAAKLFGIAEAASMAESRLLGRMQDFSTSQIAMSADCTAATRAS